MKTASLFLAIALFTRRFTTPCLHHEAQGLQMIGCYKDSSERDLPYLVGRWRTEYYCKEDCKIRGFTYFGINELKECRCGNTYGLHGSAPEHECYGRKCYENEICVVPNRNRIYKTGIKNNGSGMRLLGCFKDSRMRDLTHLAWKGDVTPTICYDSCKKRKYAYAGVQASDECWCGNSYGKYGKVSIKECHRRCYGDFTTSCGDSWRNRIYTADLTANAQGLQQIGCYKDGFERDLPYLARSGGMKPNVCKNLCQELKYTYFGLQANEECWCGNEYGQYDAAPDKECNMKCSGDSNTLCGGKLRNRIFKTGIKTPGLGMRPLGCFKDDDAWNLTRFVRKGDVTPSICHNLCKELKYAYAGVRVSDECWCGNRYGRSNKVSNQECNMSCKEDNNTLCGGVGRYRIYTADLTTNAPGMKLIGCFVPTDGYLTYMIAKGEFATMTPTICYHSCLQRYIYYHVIFYSYIALRRSDECWCGTGYNRFNKVSDSECNNPCKGDERTLCGGNHTVRLFDIGDAL